MKSFFRRPSCQAPAHGVLLDASHSRQLRSGQVLRSDSKQPRPTGVQVLLLPSRPTAVGLFVIAVVVFSVKGVSGWRVAHVTKERGESVRGHPIGADLYAPSTVMHKVHVGWVRASSNHRTPNFVDAGPRQPVRGVHAGHRCGMHFFRQTSAGLRACSQSTAGQRHHCAARASTQPCRIFPSKSILANDRQSPECLARKINNRTTHEALQ